jgi:hypothetical protein
MTKTFRVVGNRIWRTGVVGVRPSDPEPFEVMPISYDTAFGGRDDSRRDPDRVVTFLPNPVGRGFSHYKENLNGLAMPNTEALDESIVDPDGSYRPMSLGPIGRSWQPRVRYAGTYDQRWLDNEAPFWPVDFDYRYFQAAPTDQQVPHLAGGEEIVLKNLSADGEVVFKLPKQSMPVWFLPYGGKDVRLDASIDTLVIEPDDRRFMLTWRAVLPMRRSCFDIREVVVGEMPEAWWRARKYGSKPYYESLAELVKAKRRRR